ncbi:MFS transporter [Angustibacter aerolatus]
MTQERARARRRPTVRRLFASGEFSALFSARVLSDWGDALAKVALASLVLSRSGSALLSAAVFAVSFLPQVFGQAVLGPVADRLPRRALMVVCDLLRAGFVVLLVLAVLADLPLLVLLAVLFVVELVGAPFFAAGQALLTEVFTDGGLFLRASSLMQVSRQVNLVLGYAVGGTVVALVGASKALWIDAVTFALSGLLVALFVRTRPAALDGGVQGLRQLLLDLREGTSYLRRDRSLRSLVLLAWAMLLAVVAPEAVALPLAVAQGGDTRAGGVLLAAVPLGLALGAFVVGRWSPMTQVRSMLPMAALLPMPLLGLALDPRWQLVAVLYLVTGALQAFLVPLMGTFAVLAPPQLRGRLNGVAGAGFSLVSALSFLVVGFVADRTSPVFAVVLAAAVSLVAIAVAWPRWPQGQLEQAAERAYV